MTPIFGLNGLPKFAKKKTLFSSNFYLFLPIIPIVGEINKTDFQRGLQTFLGVKLWGGGREKEIDLHLLIPHLLFPFFVFRS